MQQVEHTLTNIPGKVESDKVLLKQRSEKKLLLNYMSQILTLSLAKMEMLP